MSTQNGKPARLLIVDDHAFMRAGLKVILETQTDFEIVGEAGDGQEAVSLCRALRPDLVLMDVDMPNMDGIEATRLIKAEFSEISVLVLTAHDDPAVVLDAIRAGAAGYVLKGPEHTRLIDTIRATLGGETPLDYGLAMQILRRVAEEADLGGGAPSHALSDASSAAPPNPLTPRETEILGHVATGKTNRQVAKDLHLSISTVKKHIERIISKLEVSDRTQAAVKAIELGFIPRGRAS